MVIYQVKHSCYHLYYRKSLNTLAKCRITGKEEYKDISGNTFIQCDTLKFLLLTDSNNFCYKCQVIKGSLRDKI